MNDASRQTLPAHPAPVLPPGSFTYRAILAGAVGSLVIAVGDPLAVNLIQGSTMALDFSTPGAIFLFFVLTFLINRALGLLRPGWALNPGELITAYIMMIVASAIPTMGLTAQLLPLITAPYYYGANDAQWTKYLLPVLQKRRWLSPTTPEAIKYFYEGLPEGEHIPWAAWAQPLAVWLPLICALYLVMMCMMVIIRKQWVEYERLAYPLTHLPLEMVRVGDGGRRAQFFRNPVMWAGFAIPFILGSLKGLHFYMPVVPDLQETVKLTLSGWLQRFVIHLSFPMLGFFYLVNLDTLFSLWFFSIIFQVAAGYITAHGTKWQENLGVYGTPSPFFAHLGMGAMIALVALGLYTARRHLRDVMARVVRGDPRVDDSGEMLSYRTAFWGMVGGLAFMWAWLWCSGLPPALGLAFLGGAFVLFYGLTRVVAESGLAEAVASTISAGFVVSSFGSRPFGAAGLTTLGMNYVWSSDIRTYVMASSATALRMAQATERNRRPLFWIMWLAIVIALVGSIWVTMVLAYAKGGINLNLWFFVQGPPSPYRWVVDKLANPTDPNWAGWLVRGAGFAVMWFLMFMRQAFVWWPFHPIGFAVGGTWIMAYIWATCCIAWMLKGLILRFGGLRAYHFFRPAFLGFILGQFACNGVWLVVDAFTGATGNQVFWI